MQAQIINQNITNLAKTNLQRSGIFRTNNIIKSKYNKNDYLFKQLSNGLKYLLVKDQKTDKSSAAFCVNIGSLNDPEEFQGLAHFLEHMVFMGSKPFPGENEYNDFLTKNSGYSNAYTDYSMTNYYFECSNESFLDAFKMTSRFFIDPLLNESSVDREVNAVDSEFKNGLRDDSDRIQEIFSKESHKDTPFRKFMCGNLLTLKKPGLIEALRVFFDKYYSADIITVVVYSHMDLDLLEEKIDKILIEIPNKHLTKSNSNCFSYSDLNEAKSIESISNLDKNKSSSENKSEFDKAINLESNLYSINNNHQNLKATAAAENEDDVRNYVKNGKHAYDKENLGMLYKYAGIIDKDRLTLEWNINLPYNQFYKSKPLDFIVSLLSSKGSESFILNLIKENLIIDGSAYIYNYANTFAKLTVDLDLTEEGFKNYVEVIKRVISSVEKLKDLPIKKKFFEETKKILDIGFEYHVDDDICEFVSDTARKLHVYEPQDTLYGDFIVNEFDEKLIKYFFDFLVNENLNIYLISDSFEFLFENKEFIECSEIADLSNQMLVKNIDKMDVDDDNHKEVKISRNSNDNNTNESNCDNKIYNNYFVKIKKEEIYDSRYTLEKIDFNKLNLISYNFQGLEKIGYPADNHLLPEKFEYAVDISEIKNENSKLPPRKILENESFSVHYKIDNAFYQPFIYLQAKIYLENLNIKNRHGKTFSTDEVTCYTNLWFSLLYKEIYERNSVANFSCFYFDFYDNFNYLIMKFSGYNDENKFSESIKFLFDHFIELHDLSKIENFKTKIITLITDSVKNLKNMDFDSASSQAIERFKELSFKKYCNKEVNIKILENLKASILDKNNWDDFEDYISVYLNSTYIDWLAQGHISEAKSLQFISYITSKIQTNSNLKNLRVTQFNKDLSADAPSDSSITQHQQAFLSPNSINSFTKSSFNKSNCTANEFIKFNSSKHYFHSFSSIDPKNKNSAIATYFILGKLSNKEKCIALLLQTMLGDEFFDDLRTQQCLGYTCSLYMRKYAKIDSFVCLVESSVKPPEHISNKITKFLHDNDPEAQEEDEEFLEDLKKYKSGIILDLKKKDFILGNEVDRHFEEICSREFQFEKYNEWMKIIEEEIKLEDVIKFYQKHFIYEPCRVEVGFVSQNMLEENKNTLEKNLTLTYKEIVKSDETDKNKNNKSLNNANKVKEENEEEEESEESESNESCVSVALPERILIENESFKESMETFSFNML